MSARGLAAAVLLTSACASSPAPSPHRAATQEEWTRARRELAELRASEPSAAYSVVVAVTLHEPWTGTNIDGRGAIAVAPSRALRMQIVGPSGLTALDAWVTQTAWRFDAPHLGGHRARNRQPDAARAALRLPVGFFRWWFLAPLDGELLTTSFEGCESRFVLRHDGAVIQLRTWIDAGQRRIVATRTAGEAVESIDWTGRALAPSVGDRARYENRVSGLRVDVKVESVSKDEPDPAAFIDPDSAGGAQ